MNSQKQIQPNIKPLVILLFTPVILTIFKYYGSEEFFSRFISSSNGAANQYFYFISSFVLLGLIPLLIWIFGFKLNLSSLGLSLGDYKKSLWFIAIGLPLMALLAYLSSKNPAFRIEYPLFRGLLTEQNSLPVYFAIYGLYYIGWETFFRGFMLFGLADDYGKNASILIQTIPSCLMHIGKPDAEIFASILAGIVFGWIVLRCRSIWPIFICHWGLGVFLDIFIIYG